MLISGRTDYISLKLKSHRSTLSGPIYLCIHPKVKVDRAAHKGTEVREMVNGNSDLVVEQTDGIHLVLTVLV